MEAKKRYYDKAIELQEESYRLYMEAWDANWIAKGIGDFFQSGKIFGKWFAETGVLEP